MFVSVLSGAASSPSPMVLSFASSHLRKGLLWFVASRSRQSIGVAFLSFFYLCFADLFLISIKLFLSHTVATSLSRVSVEAGDAFFQIVSLVSGFLLGLVTTFGLPPSSIHHVVWLVSYSIPPICSLFWLSIGDGSVGKWG